jgi:hypothetical protein
VSNDPESMESYLEQQAKAESYHGLLDSAAQSLAQGDGQTFVSLLSPNFVAQIGAENIERVVQEQILPFFEGAAGFGNDTVVSNTTDAWGSTGLAFYKSIVNGQGEEKPVVFYVVEEEGKPVIANVLVNTTFEDMHEGRGPGG